FSTVDACNVLYGVIVMLFFFFFFFQAEDGIRDGHVTGVQTCALPISPESERSLHEAGLFRILQPKRVGGAEFDYVALVDVADVIGRADASVAWNLVNLASHHWMLGMFDPSAQDRIWNKDPDALIASSFVFPAG